MPAAVIAPVPTVPTDVPVAPSATDRRVRLQRSPRSRAAWRSDAGWLVPLLVLFVAKGLLLVAIIGPFTGHDEVDHYWYVVRLAAGDGLGEVGKVKLPAEAKPYQEYVADYPHNAEVIQPPLYHLLLVPLKWAVPGGTAAELYAMRLVSLALGAFVVWLAYLTARLLFPAEALVRVGAPVFVAFQPQFSFEAAIVNHDILVITTFTVIVYLSLRWLREGFSRQRALALGLVAVVGI